MKKRFIKVSTFLLAMIMIIGIIPFGMFSVSAANEILPASTKYRSMKAFRDNRQLLGQNIYYGVYEDKVVLWRVLGNGTEGDNSLLMLSENILEIAAFDANDTYSTGEEVPYTSRNDWGQSDANKWCDTFESSSLSKAELAAVLQTRLNEGQYKIEDGYLDGKQIQFSHTFDAFGDYTEKLFFLSAEEVDIYMPDFLNRIATTVDGAEDFWWLRTRFTSYAANENERNAYNAAIISQFDGGFGHIPTWYDDRGYRPAFNLDATNILFLNAPSENPNPDFAPITQYDGKDWVLTLSDGKSFSASGHSGTTTLPHGYAQQSITINHSSLESMRGGYDRVTAMLTDSAGNIVCYGKINTSKTATSSTVEIPTGLPADNYTLSIRAEVWNNGGKANTTRVATEGAYEIPITVQTRQSFTAPASEPIIGLGTAAISGYNATNGYDTVVLGANGTEYLVLDTKSNTGESGALFLFAKEKVTRGQFGSDSIWSTSNARTMLISYMESKFSNAERAALMATTKSDSAATIETKTILASELAGDKIFALSAAEATAAEYGLDTTSRRTSTLGEVYWLRSPMQEDVFGTVISVIGKSGELAPALSSNSYALRPAMNFNPSGVLFTQAADDSAQTAFGYIPSASNQAWKFTLSTGDSIGSVTLNSTTVTAGATVTVTHPELGSSYNTMTAMLLKNGTPMCYGALTPVDGSSTQSTLTLPVNIENGEYTLKLYAEQWNDGTTNYASNSETVTLTVADRSMAYTGTVPAIVTYNGMALENPTADELTLVGMTYDELIFTWSGEGLVDGKPVNAGVYSLAVTAPVSGNLQPVSIGIQFTVQKADVGDSYGKSIAHTVVSGTQYSVDMPTLPEGAVLGEAETTAEIFDGNITVANGKLCFKTNDSVAKEQTYTVTIPVQSSTNFNPYDIVLTLTGDEAPAPPPSGGEDTQQPTAPDTGNGDGQTEGTPSGGAEDNNAPSAGVADNGTPSGTDSGTGTSVPAPEALEGCGSSLNGAPLAMLAILMLCAIAVVRKRVR